MFLTRRTWRINTSSHIAEIQYKFLSCAFVLFIFCTPLNYCLDVKWLRAFWFYKGTLGSISFPCQNVVLRIFSQPYKLHFSSCLGLFDRWKRITCTLYCLIFPATCFGSGIFFVSIWMFFTKLVYDKYTNLMDACCNKCTNTFDVFQSY